MKNAFEVNVSTEVKNTDKFIIKKLSGELERKQNEMVDTLSVIQKNSTAPLWLTILLYIFAFLAIVITCGFTEAALDIGFAAAYNNAGWMLYVDGVSIVLAAAIFIYKSYKLKRTENSPAVQFKLDESKKLDIQCYEELKVPSDADDIDIFTVVVKTKKDKVKPVISLFQYVNVACKIYKDSNNLYIADTSAVYCFPLNGFTKIVAKKKSASFNVWNKEEKFNKGVYKQFKVRCNNYGTFFIKPYHSVQLFAFNEDYEIIIPGYELQTLLKYVNLDVMYESK